MSIGFCTDVTETKVASRAFTVVYILLGASCVGGALVLLVQNILDEAASKTSALYKQILERDSFQKAFYSGNSDSLWCSLRRSGRERGSLSYDEFRTTLEKNGCFVSWEDFTKVCSQYDPQQKGYIRYDDFLSIFQGTEKIIPAIRRNKYKARPLNFMSRLWGRISPLFTDENKRIYLIFTCWIGMGILWGIFDQNWDPVTATHFAVSALATGGLTAPPVDENGILPTGPAIFCGVYCLFGIPLFALTLSNFARVLVERYIAEDELVSITRPLSQSEFQFASKSLCSTDDKIHLSDFIVLQLFRQGKMSVESLEFIKRQFDVLDQNNSGRLSLNEATLRGNAGPSSTNEM
jgi:Ca2+-binding EF-hand superfamily protein